MTWLQPENPWGNIGLSALGAALPILFLFWALAWKRMKGHLAASITVAIAIAVAIIEYGMPAKLAFLSTFYGALIGLFPVCWIIVTALFIYNLSVKTGQFEIIKNSLASLSDDRRMQALLIAFSFGAFIEGAAGFGTPVAITAAMLMGLGFEPLYAAGICLVANTAPVAFGAIGIPIIVGAKVAGVDELAMSQMVGRTLPFLSVLIPLYLTVLMAGWKKGIEVWPACLVSGASFAIVQYATSNFIGPMLPDILASLASIICMVIFLKIWHPKESWHFAHEKPSTGKAVLNYSGGQVFRAWAPFILLSIFVAAWGVKPIGAALNHLFIAKWSVPELHNLVLRGGKPMAAVYTMNFLSAAGTAILFAGLFSIPVTGASAGEAMGVAGDTLNKLKWPIFTIAMVIGLAYILNYSGMAVTLGLAFASTGALFPFFSAFLGWLGVFMTGSDTSSNALFGKLQFVTADKLGINPIVTTSANSSGGVCGKMISPQSLSVACAATGLIGHEGDIFRFTLKHSLILTSVIGVMAYLQAYVITSWAPAYKAIAAAAPAVASAVTSTVTTTAAAVAAAPKPAAPAFPTEGMTYLAITMGLALVITIASVAGGKKASA
jgi:lactate permease